MTSVKTARTAQPIESLLADRWSPRAFDPGRRVEPDKLTTVLEAARWAPSCFNQQPWRYLVCDRFVSEDCWQKAWQCLVPGNQRWASKAPVLIAAVSDQATPLANGDENRWADYDTGAASENLCLQASGMGLAVHQMGGFDPASLRESFNIPGGFNPIAMIALGYPGDAESLKGWRHEQEVGPRTRQPLDDIAFAGNWGVPLGTSD